MSEPDRSRAPALVELEARLTEATRSFVGERNTERNRLRAETLLNTMLLAMGDVIPLRARVTYEGTVLVVTLEKIERS
ncbi:MAG TPA: hypothetical protein VGI70_18285 [Polyangiales bacterium]